MKFSLTPFVLLASALAVATALPTDGDYNGGAIQDNSAAVTARDVQAYSDGYVPTDSVVNATSIEARGSGSAAAEDILTLGIKAAIEGFIHLADQIKQDKVDRSEFTQRVVGDLSAKDPSLNYVICHTKHEYNWDGVQGQDWSHSHQEFDIQIGGTIGYEIYAARSGEFTRKGDGGYLNWAFSGVVTTSDQDGKHLVFAEP